LNRATIAFADEAELKAILAALPRYFDAVVYLDNKFKQQWEQATQPPCLHLNLRLKRETLPAELLDMLPDGGADRGDGGGGWIVELQLSMLDFLDVKKRCHAIYEILRLRVEEEAEKKGKEKEEVEEKAEREEGGQEKQKEAMMTKMLPLPRACPVCGLLQHCVKSSQLSTLEDVSFGQKLVKKCLLLDDKGNNQKDKHEQNERRKQGEEVAFSIIAINHNHNNNNNDNNNDGSCFSELEPIFVREVGLLTRLDHPNVLQICGVVREAKYLGFVTQWVSSGTLWSWLQQQKHKKKPKPRISSSTTAEMPPHLPQDQQQTQSSTNADQHQHHPFAHHTRQEAMDVWDIAFQLCDALHYVHSHGVVHYDLKSNNVLLDLVNDDDDDGGNGNNATATPSTSTPAAPDADGSAKTQRRRKRNKFVVKLFDFGLSREIESTLRTAVKVGGTPNWQAPETWSELTCTNSSAVDVYAFGCVLIELFGQFREPGCFPWMQFKRSDKSSRKHIKNQVKNHRAKPPELDLVDDPLVRALITDCLAFEPTLRPTMKKVKARLLAAFVASPVSPNSCSLLSPFPFRFLESFISFISLPFLILLAHFCLLFLFFVVDFCWFLLLVCCLVVWLLFVFVSQMFDSNASRIFAAMKSGRLSFSSLLSELHTAAHSPSSPQWADTLSFLRQYSSSMSMSQFEVALAMCHHFAPCSSMEEASEKKATFRKQEEETKKRESSSSLLFEVCDTWRNWSLPSFWPAGVVLEESEGCQEGRRASGDVVSTSRSAGHPAAQFHLGLYHLSQGRGDEGSSCSSSNKHQREQEAARWFEKAAKQGHVGAQLRLMKCYQLGEGVEVDWAMGEKWLQRASASYAIVVQRDEVEEVTSAERGNLEDQSNLGQSSQEYKLGGEHQSTCSDCQQSKAMQLHSIISECVMQKAKESSEM